LLATIISSLVSILSASFDLSTDNKMKNITSIDKIVELVVFFLFLLLFGEIDAELLALLNFKLVENIIQV